MKITETKVTKIQITDIKGLDTTNVILEDFNHGQGKITIECFGKAWTAYWNAMGKNNTIDKFFCDCDNNYLSEKLDPQLQPNIPSENKLQSHAHNYIIKLRKDNEITKEKAKKLIDIIKNHPLNMNDHDTLYEIYGKEWWCNLPQEPNPEYQYLGRIIDTVREALKKRILDNELPRH